MTMRVFGPILLAGFILARLAQADSMQEQAEPGAQKDASSIAPRVEASNVLFRYSPQLAVLIVRLRGTLTPTEGHAIASFNDPSSFAVTVEAAEMRLTTNQLSSLMNARLTSSPRAQVKNVHIRSDGSHLLIDGTMNKGLHVPFHAVAYVGVTQDNRIRIDVRQVKVARVEVKGVLDALGLDLEDLVSQKGLKGMSVAGNSFVVDPQTAFPSPHIKAVLSSARVEGDGIALRFGRSAPKLTMGEKGNYLALRGGRIEYGREQMFDSDLTMTDSTPADPFEFYLAQYWRQMVAGTIKVTPDKALRIRVPDFAKISNRESR